MAPSPNITELDKHLKSVLAKLPHYRNRSRLESDARHVMRVHPSDVAIHEVSRSVLNGLASIAFGSTTQQPNSARGSTGGATHSAANLASTQLEPVIPMGMPPTVDCPWSLVPEVVKWGNADWFRFTGKLTLYTPAMAARDASRPQGGATGVLGTLASAPASRTMAVAASLARSAAGDNSSGPPELASALRVKVHLWLPESYPEGYPLMYIFGGKHTRLVPHPHVDVQGRVFLPAISGWNPNANINQILHEAISIFAAQPPIQSTLLENSAATAAKKAKVAAFGAIKFARGILQAASQASSDIGRAASQASGGPGSSSYEATYRAPGPQGAGAAAASSQEPSGPPAAAPAQIEPQFADPAKDKDTPATEPGTECVVCLSNKKAAFFLPCGHVTCCMECGRGLKECCLCRAPIQQVFKAYI